jgi:small subunit ribosomal protein S11
MSEEAKKKSVAVVEPPVSPAEDISAPAEAEGAKKRSKKGKRQVSRGRASIQCTYNNTIVTLTDQNGAVLGWSSSGHLGFKGAKKSTPYAATQVVADVTEKVKKYGLSELDVFVKGVGSGREASVRALSNNGFSLLSIKDITPIPHNGCRPKRPRRI